MRVCLSRNLSELNLRLLQDLRVVLVHKGLDGLERHVLELNCLLRENFPNLVQRVHANVLVPDVLEDFPRQLATFEADAVDKVTEISPCAAGWTVVVAARN